MLDQFRSLSGSLPAKILLGFLVVSFGVWGIGDMLRNQGRQTAVATIGSITISAGDFTHAMRRETENIRNALGDRYSPDIIRSLNLPQRVLRKQIDHALLALESRSIGLVPSDAEVAQRIRDNPAFQNSAGHFDKDIFEATLRDSGIQEKVYVRQLREDIASGLLVSTLLSATPVPDIAVRTLYDAQEEQRAVTIYTIPASLAAHAPQPARDQVQAYYNAHKNDFTAPEYRVVSYAVISPDDVQAPPVSEDQLKAAYKDRIDDFRLPERRTVEQLLYSSQDKAKAAEILLKNGKSFEEVARRTSILNKNNLSLGDVARNTILQSAANAVFALPVGGYTAPIHSPFGWHIFRVSAIKPPSVASFESVRAQLAKDLQQRDIGETQSTVADKLQDALAGGATLQEAAAQLKLKLYDVGPLDHNGLAPDGSKAKGIPDFDKFIDTAFKTDGATESSLMTAKNGVFYILRVDKIIPDRLRPLDEVKSLVVAGWQKERRQEDMSQLAKTIASAFADPAKRADTIKKYNLKPTSGSVKRNGSMLNKAALPQELVNDIFQRNLQENTASYASGNGDYLIAVVTGVIPAPPPDKDPKLTGEMADIRSKLEDNMQNEALEQYVDHLAVKYGVSVNQTALESAIP